MNRYFSTRRIEALTDGVFAIAMTLLVLNLSSRGFGSPDSSLQLLKAFNSNLGSIISFVVSFLLLGSMWAVHMRQFEYIDKADRHFTMINTLRLLAVVLIPMTTSIAGNYSDIVLGRILLPLNFLVLAAISYWQWRYAVDQKVINQKTPVDVVESAEIRNRAILLISALVLVAAVWIGEIAFVLFIAVPFVVKLLKR
ncbi:MAG: TMEM175 family protein [Candidatus Saccharimonadales bacterium]